MTKENKNQRGRLSPALATGTLKTTGKPYSIHMLDISWAEDIYALHMQVISGLTPEQKTHLAPRTKEFFEEHLKNEGTILGVISEDKLIAKSFIREPKEGDPHSTTKIQANTVNEDYQNNGLTQHLVKTWVTLSWLRGHKDLAAEVDVGNTASLKTLLKGGLEIVDINIDAEDGGTNYILKASVKTAALSVAFNKVAVYETVHIEPLSEQMKIAEKIKDGYKGVHVDQDNQMTLVPKDSFPRL